MTSWQMTHNPIYNLYLSIIEIIFYLRETEFCLRSRLQLKSPTLGIKQRGRIFPSLGFLVSVIVKSGTEFCLPVEMKSSLTLGINQRRQ